MCDDMKKAALITMGCAIEKRAQSEGITASIEPCYYHVEPAIRWNGPMYAELTFFLDDRGNGVYTLAPRYADYVRGEYKGGKDYGKR